MNTIQTVAVYCSSSNKVKSSYFEQAHLLGQLFAKNQINLVYGDGGIGLMNEIASGVLSEGGKVIGVIPQFMVDQGWNNRNSTETYVVSTMHERKALIEKISDGMVALPGGIGTFEELLECLTWKQLGLHTKPVVIFNMDGYYDNLLKCLDQMIEENMMRPIHRDMFIVVEKAEEVIPALLNAPIWDKNIRREAAI
jgi:uncharacterized protein (TIGR00730 family)